MPPYDKRDGDVAVFKNTRKTNPKAPDYKGDALVNGVVMEVGLWLKKDKNGNTFLVGTIKPKSSHPMGQRSYRREEDDNDGL